MATELPLLFGYEFPRGALPVKCALSTFYLCSRLCWGGGSTITSLSCYLPKLSYTSCPIFFQVGSLLNGEIGPGSSCWHIVGFSGGGATPSGHLESGEQFSGSSRWLSDHTGIEWTTARDCCHSEELSMSYITRSVLPDNDVGEKPVFNHLNLEPYHKVLKFWGLGCCFVSSIM